MKKRYWPVISTLFLSALIVSSLSFRPTADLHGPPVNLYLHLDKSIYQPGETIWFTGYILNRDIEIMRAQNTLYAVLVDVATRKPILQQRFLIKDGLGKGFLSLPDSLTEGDYWVMAYTNAWLEQGPQPVFRQLISLRTGYLSPFKVSEPTVLSAPNADTFRIRYKVSTSYNGVAAGGKFKYTLFGNASPVKSGEQTIDSFGELTIMLDSGKIAGKDLQLTARVSRDGLTKSFILPVNDPLPATSDAGPIHSPRFASRGGPQASGNFPSTSPIDSLTSPSRTSFFPVKITVQPDSAEYHQRSKITLHIRIRDSAGNRMPAIFSIAVVASKKLTLSRTASINEYADKPATIPNARLEFPDAFSAARYKGNTHMPDYGYVLCDDQIPQKPVSLTLMGKSFASIITDSAGRFELSNELLVSPVGGVNYLSVAEKFVDRYKVTVCSKTDTLDKQLASLYYPIDLRRPELPDADADALLSSPDLLKTAIVKKKLANGYDFLTDEFRSNRCDTDFICVEPHDPRVPRGSLNCPFGNPRHPYPDPGGGHPYPREKPEEGREYVIFENFSRDESRGIYFGHKITYHCMAPVLPPFVKNLQPILLEKPFQPPGSLSPGPTGPGLQSTLFWNYALSTFDKEEVTVSFYANDLTGPFTCILQGVSSEGLISQRSSFAVKPIEN